MNINQVTELKRTFDDYKHIDENGKEYWNAHELSKAMGYSEYSHFKPAIERARTQMISTGKNPEDHLAGSREMINIGKGGKREVNSYKLDKYAAYNVAMNADPAKTEVAFAQEYFLQSTAKAEMIQKRLEDKDYILRRNELREANKSLHNTLINHDVKEEEVGIVMDAGDQGFFGMHTRDVKKLAGIPANKPVADVMGARMATAKALAQYATEQSIVDEDARGVTRTSEIAYKENRDVRDFVQLKFHDTPENLITGEDVHKVEKKYNKDTTELENKLVSD